jgi:Mg/Co/Ni transporter MgtE
LLKRDAADAFFLQLSARDGAQLVTALPAGERRLWGSIAGSLLPFILRALGFDPASAPASFVATLVDVTGLLIYFTVAAFVLRGTLL